MRRPVKFGRYLLLDRISVGGMAEVFKAKIFGLQGFEKIVAVKRMLPSLGKDPDFVDMFIDEAKISGQLAHANIGQIHELGKVGDAHFIAMEFIWGRDLLQLQNRFKKTKKLLSVRTTCFIVMKVCEGLHYAHKKRDVMGAEMMIVHRDCSPQNVLISFEGEVKVIDFGIAKAASRNSKTTAGVLKGKFGYMSPEQVRGLPLDRRTDIFSIGTILFESLTGKRLFHGENDFTTLEKVRNAIVEIPELDAAGVPEEVRRIVCKALERNPENRYQWCSELRADLHAFLQKGESAYTNRMLGEEMREAFAVELAREQELMDIYSKIDSDGVFEEENSSEVLVSVGIDEDESVPAGSQPSISVVGSKERRPDGEDGEFEDSPTEIFGEFGSLDLGIDPAAIDAGPSSAEQSIEVEDMEKPTIEMSVSVPELAAAVQAFSDASSSNSADDGVQPFGSFSPAVPTAVTTAPKQPIQTTMAVPKMTLTNPIPTPGVRNTTLNKERDNRGVIVGLSIAVAVLLIALGLKMFLFSDSSDENPATLAARATLVVLVDDNQSAEVSIDGKLAGKVPVGDSLTIDTLKPGAHTVVVRRSGAVLCEETLQVKKEKIEVYNCRSKGLATGELTLKGVEKGDSLVLNGQPVSAELLASPLKLAVGKVHLLALSREGKGVHEFKLSVDSGEQVEHLIVWDKPTETVDPKDGGVLEGEQGGEEVMEMQPDLVKPRLDKLPSNGVTQTMQGAGDSVKGGAVEILALAKNKKPELPDATEDGYLMVWSKPWARIFIDGKDTGKVTPVVQSAKLVLPPGKHNVTLVVGSIEHKFSVRIAPGKLYRLSKILK